MCEKPNYRLCDNCIVAKGVQTWDADGNEVFADLPDHGYCSAPEDRRHAQVDYIDCKYFVECDEWGRI